MNADISELRERAAQTRRVIRVLGNDVAAKRLLELTMEIELNLAVAEQNEIARLRATGRQPNDLAGSHDRHAA